MVRQWLKGRDVAVVYALILIIVALVLEFGPDSWRDQVVSFSSTNLANLRRRPIMVLIFSAFIIPSVSGLWLQIPLVLVTFGAVERWIGRAATIVVAVFGHVGATLMVGVLLVTGITHGLVDPSIRHADDVGVSYGVVALAGLFTVRLNGGRVRLIYACALSAFFLSVLLISKAFSDLGHLLAWVIGLALALLVTAARRQALSERI